MNNLNQFPIVKKLNGRKAIFLLGTDQYIGEGLDENGKEKESETRVGVVPDQVKKIKAWLESNGVALDFFFVKGAGTKAGFLDSEYLKIDGQLLFEHQLSTMPAPNVVHALKEPSSYEAFIPGPFLRIGALHSGAFDDTSGVSFLFKRRNFCAIFDGSNIGTADGRNIPIRGAMSVFAGEIAAEFSADHFIEKTVTNAKVVISGGGVVGKASLRRLLEIVENPCSEIILVEPNKKTVEALKEEYSSNSEVQIVEGKFLTTEQVKNANSVILTAFVKGLPAPNVLMFDDIKQMSDSSIIVDVSIDEKGGIKLENFEKEKVSLPEVVAKVSKEIDKLGKGITYIADDHLPKHKPKKASFAHGEAILPYIAMLLYCSAKLGGARQVSKYILDGNFSDQTDERAKEILEHLKCGLAFYSPAPVKYSSSIISDENNKTYLENFFKEGSIEFETFE
jgi:alanine dehydrogenase